MDLLDILRVLRRRWVVAAVAAAVGVALLIAATSVVEPDWDGRAEIILQGPFEETRIDDLGQEQIITKNPLLSDGAGSLAVQILWVRVTSQEVKTTFAEAGLSTNYQFDFALNRPFMSVFVTDSDPSVVEATLDQIIEFFNFELDSRQDRVNIDPAARVELEVLAETEIAANLTTRRRAQGAIVVLALIGAVIAATVADTLIRKRDQSDIEENVAIAQTTAASPVTHSPATPAEPTPRIEPPEDGSGRWGRRGPSEPGQ